MRKARWYSGFYAICLAVVLLRCRESIWLGTVDDNGAKAGNLLERSVWTVSEPEIQLVVQVEQAGARQLIDLAFTQGEIAAFLILFCRKSKIPLPRSADKFLEVENGCLSLVITKQVFIENLASLKTPN